MAKAITPSTTPAVESSAPDLVAGLAAETVTIEAVAPSTAQLDPTIRSNPDVPEWFIAAARTAPCSSTTASGDCASVVTSWTDVTRLHMFTDADADAEDRPELTADTHLECPGRTLHVSVSVYGLADDDVIVAEGCSRPELHQPKWKAYATTVAGGQLTHSLTLSGGMRWWRLGRV